MRYPRAGFFEKELLARGLLFRAYQWRYFFHDYVFKKPYKVISCESEFGAELKWYIPFAYWHYKNGTLLRTESARDSSCLYFFSKNHVESDVLRKYVLNREIPNSEDHNHSYDLKKWAPPPYGTHFFNKRAFDFKKPLLIISNKFTTEWDRPPVNFISASTVLALCASFKDRYQIIYNRPTEREIPGDTGSDFVFSDDKEKIKKAHPEVFLLEELYEKRNRPISFNEFQFSLYASSGLFISVQGGNSVLASYFGGKNIVLVKEGHELIFHEYQNFYHKISGSMIILCQTEEELFRVSQKELLGTRQ